jgi:hypothetical protein
MPAKFGKGDFSKVFPSIDEISVEVRAWADGVEKLYAYDRNTLTRFVDCWNSRCRGGKFDLEPLIRSMLHERLVLQHFPLICPAQEFGRKPKPCQTRCEITIGIRYKGTEVQPAVK